MFKKAMLYLGLGSDEDFEALDREATGEDYDRVRPIDESGSDVRVQPPAAVPTGPVDPDAEQPRTAVSAVRPIPADQVPEPARRSSVVRPLAARSNAKPHIVSPTSFNDAQEVADTFKRNQPVIVNLQQADTELMRRLIDFAAGLCYGVGGDMKKVADAVYLLTPADVEVSDEERQRLQQAGLHD
ncbi:MAG: cell division protein SepF [Acidimicrobiales bacterium]